MSMYIRLGLVAGVLLLVWYTYNQGVEAGVNKTVATYSAAKDLAVSNYQDSVEKQANDYNRKLVEIRKRYESELDKQNKQAQYLAQEIAQSSDKSAEIKGEIPNVQSDCTNIGGDAYSLYKRSRRIISDPRETNFK